MGNLLQSHESKPTYNRRLCQPHQDSKGAGASKKAGESEQMKKGDSVLAEVTSLNCAAYTALKDSGISVRLHILPKPGQTNGFERNYRALECTGCMKGRNLFEGIRSVCYVGDVLSLVAECDVQDVPHAGYKEYLSVPLCHASSLLHELVKRICFGFCWEVRRIKHTDERKRTVSSRNGLEAHGTEPSTPSGLHHLSCHACARRTYKAAAEQRRWFCQ